MNSEYEAIRKDQEAEGRRIIRMDQHVQKQDRPRLNMKKRTPTQAPKGHESFLKALEQSGSKIYIEKISSGSILEGIIKHSDKYTISLLVRGETRVIFKHDISEFWTEARQPAVN